MNHIRTKTRSLIIAALFVMSILLFVNLSHVAAGATASSEPTYYGYAGYNGNEVCCIIPLYRNTGE